MAGLFISIDGIDGCGKSTQIELLANWLRENHQSVTVVRDPGGTKLGEALREILLHREEIPLSMQAEMLMYMASRAQLVNEVILPTLEKGECLVADRFLLANVVYQGSGGGLETETIWNVGGVATGGLSPDQTFVLDLPADVAMARLSGKRDRLESRGVEYMSRVRDGFIEEAKHLGDQCLILDATESIESIHNRIRQSLASHLG